jgi:eukaryotic-like serine/threonine-protein kinase
MSGLGKMAGAIRGRSVWEIVGSYLVMSWVALQVLDTLSTVAGLPLWFARVVFILLVVGFFILLLTGLLHSRWVGRVAAEADSPAEHAARGLRGLLTWRRAIATGIAAFALLGAFTAAWLGMRALGIGPAGSLIAKGVLDERGVVLLADFSSPDSTLARAATEALRVDLSQSPSVRLAEPAVVSEALARMERDPGSRLDESTARELAVREGIPAVLSGEVIPAGSGYVFSARLSSPGDAAVLLTRRENAKDASDVIPAIDRLSRGIRERIGEPLRSVQASPALSRVTTGSLEALKKFSQGTAAARAGDGVRAIELHAEAVELDSAFAFAWAAMATQLGNFGEQRSRQATALRHAFENRERLTARERALVEGIYYLQGTFEPERALQAYRALLELDPGDATALNNMAVAYSELRDFERTEAVLLRAREADTTAYLYWTNLADLRVRQGRFEDAHAELDDAVARFGENGPIRWYRAMLAASRGDVETAMDLHRGGRRIYAENLLIRALLDSDLASMAATRGRLAEAERHATAALETNETRGVVPEALDDVLFLAWLDLLLRDDRDRAVGRVEEALSRHPLDGLDPLDRPYAELASFRARTGDPARARALLAEYEAAVPPENRGKGEIDRRRALGEIALAEGRHEDAVAEFRASDRGDCLLCALPGLAAAYDRAGRRDSAISVYGRFIDTPWIDRYWGDDFHFAFLLGPIDERLAILQEEAGDLDAAAVSWARLVELWEGADAELQPREAVARERLAAILAERG